MSQARCSDSELLTQNQEKEKDEGREERNHFYFTGLANYVSLPLTSNYSFPSFSSFQRIDGYNYFWLDWGSRLPLLLRITSGYRHLSLIRTKSYQGPISRIKQTLACARRVIKSFCQILETFIQESMILASNHSISERFIFPEASASWHWSVSLLWAQVENFVTRRAVTGIVVTLNGEHLIFWSFRLLLNIMDNLTEGLPLSTLH